MRLDRTIFLVAGIVAIALAGCSKKEEILDGERFDVRTPLTDTLYSDAALVSEGPVGNLAVAIKLPKARNMTRWTHRNGGPDHLLGNISLNGELTRLWSADIGAGNDAKHAITSDPIVAGGLIFTLDSSSRVMAHSLIGAAVWVRDLTPPSDKTKDASGGGLAYDDGVVYATTGFGEVTALRAKDGAPLWTQKLNAPVTAPPTVHKGRVYVISRDNQAWSLKAKNGRIDWQQQSTAESAGLMGGASAAVAGRNVVLPFSSGEMIAAMTRNGLRVWSVAVSGSRRGQGLSDIGDISSDPVVTRSRVYAANQSGRATAVSRKDGKRIWTANEGSYSPVLPVGNSVFLISDEAKLVRLSDRDGDLIWSVALPHYKREKTRRFAFAHFGPVLAGGRLIVASGDGKLRSYDPVSGALLGEVDIPGGAASQPAIVDGVLYILSGKGQLHAYR